MEKDELHLPLSVFIERVKSQVNQFLKVEPHFNPDAFTLLPGQAMYVVQYDSLEITYHKNIEQLLGYKDEEFNSTVLLKCFHPDQTEQLTRIIKCAVQMGIEHKAGSQLPWMFLIYKFKTKSGTYKPILRQTSILERHSGGGMYSAYSILTDLSGVNNADVVQWKIEAEPHYLEKFKKFINQSLPNPFSKREIEVLTLLSEGLNSSEIAEILFISKHTIDTHRRRLLAKSGTRNTAELIAYARKMGIL